MKFVLKLLSGIIITFTVLNIIIISILGMFSFIIWSTEVFSHFNFALCERCLLISSILVSLYYINDL